jgi:hypothetical protein
MNFAKRVGEVGGIIFWLSLMVGVMALGIALLVGAISFSFVVLNWTPRAFEITLAVSLFVLGPLALIPPTRGLSAYGFMIVSFAFGAILWVWGMAFTYAVWGALAVVIGLIVLGVGVVPVAMLAALTHGDWGNLLAFVIMAALTYGSRMLAFWLAQKVEERTARLAG